MGQTCLSLLEFPYGLSPGLYCVLLRNECSIVILFIALINSQMLLLLHSLQDAQASLLAACANGPDWCVR